MRQGHRRSRDLAKELDAGGFLFAGDDLGDVEAFEAVAELREQGLPTLLVCSASDEESALVELLRRRRHGPRRASSTCSAGSPPTPATCAPDARSAWRVRPRRTRPVIGGTPRRPVES